MGEFQWFFIAISIALTIYYTLYNLSFLLLFARANIDIVRETRWPRQISLGEIFANPLTPGVSIIVPAHNEEAGIVPAVDALRSLRYPLVRLVIVDDGSTDNTFTLLHQALDLVETSVPFNHAIMQEGEILSTWQNPTRDVTVIRKKSTGRRSDAVNAGLRVADQELVCMIDADSLLETDALLHVVEPFLLDPTVVGVGGVVRPANGAVIERGRVVDVQAPKGWLERIQALEYLRAFLIGRTGWSAMNGLMIISGAFGVFRRESLIDIGGLDPDTLAEDADIVLALHQLSREKRQRTRITFVPTPVCWTEVPNTWSALGRQRARWSQGLGELLSKYKKMILNPRYGVMGMFTMPYFLLFEYLGPLIGVLGLTVTLVSAVMGWIPWGLFWLTISASIGLGFVVSAMAVVIEEANYYRLSRSRDALALLLAAAYEPFVFYFAHSWWRLKGVWRHTLKRESEWGSQQRTGFAQQTTAPPQ